MTDAADAQPPDFDALRRLILAQRDGLPRRIAQIAAYALDHPDEIAFGTVASIAVAADVQPSTLIRFAQTFGFDGFSSLQDVFRRRLRARTSSYDERLSRLRRDLGGGGARGTLAGLLAASHQSLDRIAASADERLLEQAVAVLAAAETIYVVARRRAYPVATYAAYALAKLGIRVQLVESPAGLTGEMLAFATPRDAALAISFSPYTPSTVEEARLLHARGVPVVSLTDSAFSPLAQCSTLWFEVAEADFGGFRTLAASMALAMALAVGIGEARRERRRTDEGRDDQGGDQAGERE
jgi:DNA-binding MurR/RpiR family transcriptional regulator